MSPRKLFAYVSSWSHGESTAGLRSYAFDEETGTLDFRKEINSKDDFNVSLLDTRKNILYVVNEIGNLPGLPAGGGRLFAYALNPEDGDAKMLNCVPTCCASPSYLALDPTGKYLIVSNMAGRGCVTKLVCDALGKYRSVIEYDDAAVELFSIREDGGVGEILDAVRHYEGALPIRKGSKPHSVVMSPSGKLFAVCDKGNDQVYLYSIDPEHKTLKLTSVPYSCRSGSQPRYGVFHPRLPYFYHNCENTAEICGYRYDESGALAQIGLFPALPRNRRSGEWEQQGLCIAADGAYIYDVVRRKTPHSKKWPPGKVTEADGSECVAVLKVNAENGRLDLIQTVDLKAKWARGCTLSPDGKYLAVCAMVSGDVHIFSVDGNGLLTDTGHAIDQPRAEYITFFAP